jgi:hypothetical protein
VFTKENLVASGEGQEPVRIAVLALNHFVKDSVAMTLLAGEEIPLCNTHWVGEFQSISADFLYNFLRDNGCF